MAGQTIVRDGVIYEVSADGKTATVIGRENTGPIGGVNPAQRFEAPKAAAGVISAEANARVDSATVDAQIRLANAQATAAQALAGKAIAESNAGGGPTKGQNKADETFAVDYAAWTAGGGKAGLENKLRVLDESLTTLENSDTITGTVFGRLPKFIQQMVNPASQDVRADVEKAIQESLRQTLGAAFTAKEGEGILARTYDPTQPEASNTRRLKNLITELKSSGSAKGSAADYFARNGTIAGWSANEAQKGSVFAQTFYGPDGEASGAAAFGADTMSEAYPAEGQAKHAALIQQLTQQGGGRIDPQAYVEGRMAIDAEFGMQGDPNTYATWADGVNNYFNEGGKTVPTDIAPSNRDMSTTEFLRNSAVNNPVGAGFTGFADSMTLGGISALGGDKFDALSEDQFGPMMAGQILGAIGGTSGLAMAGREAVKGAAQYGGKRIGSMAPRLLEGGGKAQFGRNVATDVAYSGAYGGVTEGDPLSGALMGAVGSGVGQGVGRALGGAIGGVKASPAAQYLRDRNIPLTAGQTMGGMAKSIEDKATSIPLIGDIINTRRREGLQAFNRAAFDDAGRPIGYAPQNTGNAGLDELLGNPANNVQGATGRAYDSATAGANVPLDDQLFSDIASTRAMGGQLPDDLAARFGKAMDNRVNPLMNGGQNIYHGTSPQAANNIAENGFDLSRSADGSAWFTSNPNIGEVAATGKGAVVNRSIDEGNMKLGGWAETDKFGTDELIRDGYDGLKLVDGDTTTYQIFNPEKLGNGATMTGEQYQQAMRGLKSYRAEATKPGFEQDYREALGSGMDALTGQMNRGGGESVVSGLRAADGAYRNSKTLKGAVDSAAGGSGSGENFIFTPPQLQRAGLQSAKKYPGPRPFAELADYGQEVLPSRVPDSGTAGRAMLGGLGVLGLGGAAGGEAYLTEGDMTNTARATAALGTLAALGTRGGQRAINGAITIRPETLKRVGEQVRRRQGMFGAATLPYALGY
jgi:hypothetical protein